MTKGPKTLREQVLHFIKTNPGKTALKIAEGIGFDRLKVRGCIGNLMTDGRIWSDGGRANRKYYGPDVPNPEVKFASTEDLRAPVCNSRMPNGDRDYWAKYTRSINTPARLDAGKEPT